MQILVEDDDGRTSEIEGVHWPAIGWTDAVTMLRVEGDVLGWRPPPFRREPPPAEKTKAVLGDDPSSHTAVRGGSKPDHMS